MRFKCKYSLIVKNISISSYSLYSNNSVYHKYAVSSIQPIDKRYQVLPLRARVDLGAMAMKGYSAFPKAPALLEPHHQIV